MRAVHRLIIRRLCLIAKFIRSINKNQEKTDKNNLFVKFSRNFSKIYRYFHQSIFNITGRLTSAAVMESLTRFPQISSPSGQHVSAALSHTLSTPVVCSTKGEEDVTDLTSLSFSAG